MADEVGALKEGKGFTRESVMKYTEILNTQIMELKTKVKELEALPPPVHETVKTVVDDAHVKRLEEQVKVEQQARINDKKNYETEKLALNNKIAELTKAVTQFSGELDKAKRLLQESVQKNRMLAGKDTEVEGEITKLQEEISTRSQQIQSLETKLSQINQKLTESEVAKELLEKAVAAKDAEILELQSKAKEGTPIDITNIDITNVSPIVQQLLDGARQASEETKRAAAKEADDIRVGADLYAAQTKSAADEYSKKCHRDADGYALGVKAEADKYADKSRSDGDAYCKQVTESADKVARDTTSNAHSEAAKIISDATKEARNAKAEAEQDTLLIATAVKDIKDILKSQINGVAQTLADFSKSFNQISENATKVINKATNSTATTLRAVDNPKINNLLQILEDVKNGKVAETPPQTPPETQKKQQKKSAFNLGDLDGYGGNSDNYNFGSSSSGE